jgi:hypothetical protein
MEFCCYPYVICVHTTVLLISTFFWCLYFQIVPNALVLDFIPLHVLLSNLYELHLSFLYYACISHILVYFPFYINCSENCVF